MNGQVLSSRTAMPTRCVSVTTRAAGGAWTGRATTAPAPRGTMVSSQTNAVRIGSSMRSHMPIVVARIVPSAATSAAGRPAATRPVLRCTWCGGAVMSVIASPASVMTTSVLTANRVIVWR